MPHMPLLQKDEAAATPAHVLVVMKQFAFSIVGVEAPNEDKKEEV